MFDSSYWTDNGEEYDYGFEIDNIEKFEKGIWEELK